MTITTLGIDIARSVFQLHGVDADGSTVLQKKLWRGAVLDFLGKLERCLIGIEACATSHHWAREIAALGHDVRLIPPAYVKPYVKRQKNDAADAEAICEAVIFCNKRRGSLVDETALAEALVAGHLGGAVIDVTQDEPLPSGHAFWATPRMILTQHTSGGTVDEIDRKIDWFLDNLDR